MGLVYSLQPQTHSLREPAHTQAHSIVPSVLVCVQTTLRADIRKRKTNFYSLQLAASSIVD